MLLRTFLIALAVGVAGCGGEAETPEQPEAAEEAPPPAVPVEDAVAMRDELMKIAAEGATSATDFASYNPYEIWEAEFPDLEIVGRDDAATPTAVSALGSFFKPDDKAVTSAENPWILTIAVADSSGGCAAGILAAAEDGEPPDIFRDAEAAGECTAAAVYPSPDELPL